MKRTLLLGAALALIGLTTAEAAAPVTAGSALFVVTATPAVTASSAYASGNEVGPALTFTMATQSSGTGFVQGAWLNFKSAQTAPVNLLLFSALPPNTTFTDKAAFSLNTADFALLVGVIPISSCFPAGTPSICQSMGGATPIRVQTGTTLYGVLVTQGTQTFTTTSDVQVNLQIIQDLP